MNRLIVATFVMASFAGCVANADDYYTVRVDTVGYIDSHQMDEQPTEAVLSSIEVVTRPGSPFQGKVILGTRTILLRGKVEPRDSGGFLVSIRYSDSVETGNTILAEDGKTTPVLNESKCRTSITAVPGTPITLSRLEATRTERADTESPVTTRSKRTLVLHLEKYEAPRD